MRKRMISVILTVVMLCSMGMGTQLFSVHAQVIEDAGIQPLYSYTAITTVALNIDNGVAICSANLEGYEGITTKVSVDMTLQKKTLWWWSEVQTWHTTCYDCFVICEESTTVGSGTYRVKAEFIAYSGTASESITSYSQEYSY